MGEVARSVAIGVGVLTFMVISIPWLVQGIRFMFNFWIRFST